MEIGGISVALCAAARRGKLAVAMPRIVCADDLPCAREAFSTLGEPVLRRDLAITAADLADADALVVRSGVRVNAALLAGSRVKFVGTATIGYDHLDARWLERSGIRWVSAPGCNANSVAEWLLAALFALARRGGFRLAGKTLGVIGHGNVGRRVEARARAIGLRVLRNDPPRARESGDPAYRPLEEVLAASDFVTLHVPLEREGADPTHHLADERFFAMLKPGAVFVNAARGAIVKTSALLAAMERGIVRHAVLDTWEDEPACRAEILQRADLGAAHIAGHSYEGKVMGTAMVYRAACDFFGVAPSWSPETHLAADLPGHPARLLRPSPAADAEAVVAEAVLAACDIERDNAAFRGAFSPDAEVRARNFRALRKAYPVRREFAWHTVETRGLSSEARRGLRDLGFHLR